MGGGILPMIGYGIILAMARGPIGSVSAPRETGVVFAAPIAPCSSRKG